MYLLVMVRYWGNWEYDDIKDGGLNFNVCVIYSEWGSV